MSTATPIKVNAPKAPLAELKARIAGAADEARAAGLCILPPTENGEKRPLVPWEKFQGRQPTDAEHREWYPGRTGLGVICGGISGGVEVEGGEVVGGLVAFEFDDLPTYHAFKERAEAAGLADLVERIEAGYLEYSPKPGVHLLFRCPEIGGNAKLAERPVGPRKRVVLIETRESGGYLVLAPSGGKVHPSGKPYELIRGSFATIATITADERAELYGLARTFDESDVPAVDAWQTTATGNGSSDGWEVRPGDEYCDRHMPGEVLERNGWVKVSADSLGRVYWRRPDKAIGISAVTAPSGLAYAWTTSTALPHQKGLNAFSLYAWLQHGGDFVRAAKALHDQGYGRKAPSSNGKHNGHQHNGHASANGHHVEVRAEEPPVDIEDLDITDRWPVCEPPAFHGIIGELVDDVLPHTESDPVAILAQMLVAAGNLIGRGPHFTVGATPHYLSLFVALVGATSTGRKGTSWDVVAYPLRQVDQDWADHRVQGGLVSGEGLIHHVRDAVTARKPKKAKKGAPTDGETIEVVDEGVADKRLLVLESELSRALKAANRESNTLSDVIRQAYDCRHVLATLGKHAPTKATGAHISIIGHTTAADVRKHLAETDVANGFGNRFLWICSRRSKLLPRGTDLTDGLLDRFGVRLQGVVSRARRAGKMVRTREAETLWFERYEGLSAERPGLLGAILGRAVPHVMRLACTYALLDGRAEVDVEHLEAALALWRYAEASARYVFGESLGDPVAEKLLEGLKARPEGLTRSEILIDVFGRHRKAEQVAKVLGELLTAGMVHRQAIPPAGGKGRPAERWFLGRGPK